MPAFRYQLDSIAVEEIEHLEKSLESVRGVAAVHIDPGSASVEIEHRGADEREILAVLREEGVTPRGT